MEAAEKAAEEEDGSFDWNPERLMSEMGEDIQKALRSWATESLGGLIALGAGDRSQRTQMVSPVYHAGPSLPFHEGGESVLRELAAAVIVAAMWDVLCTREVKELVSPELVASARGGQGGTGL